MTKFNEWVSSIADAGRKILAGRPRQGKNKTLASLCSELCTSKGEAMGTAIADEVVQGYLALNSQEQLDFFRLLYKKFSADPKIILNCAEAFKQAPNKDTYRNLCHAVESPRERLFSRINMAPKGTATLIKMRSDLMAVLPKNPDLAAIDYDLKNLMISWFNRGFLTLEQISWRTPALILEKLIAYEAVHEMTGWDDLRRRLADDRRCFAFFHPALEDDPLIFVEVALVKGIAGNVQELLADRDETADVSKFDTAIFYSISNCQEGLKGISFGNFLIKQVVMELRNEFAQLKQFATLSPIPGFRRWLSKEIAKDDGKLIKKDEKKLLQILESDGWADDKRSCEALKPVLMRLCAHYLYHVKDNKKPLDSVARFHSGNGASMARLNWMGDRSANGLRQSAGILANYSYILKDVEENHEAFFNEGKIATSSDFQKLLK